jgi:hypothetical protein
VGALRGEPLRPDDLCSLNNWHSVEERPGVAHELLEKRRVGWRRVGAVAKDLDEHICVGIGGIKAVDIEQPRLIVLRPRT